MQICFGFKIFFFLRPNLEFRPVFTETPEIDWNNSKFFQSGIGTPWTKILELPLRRRELLVLEGENWHVKQLLFFVNTSEKLSKNIKFRYLYYVEVRKHDIYVWNRFHFQVEKVLSHWNALYIYPISRHFLRQRLHFSLFYEGKYFSK